MPDATSGSPYIRTYAKDLAEISGQPAPTFPVRASVPASITHQKTSEDERNQILERLKERAKKDPITEGVLLPDSAPTPLPSAPSTSQKPEDFIVRPAMMPAPDPSQVFTPQAPIPKVFSEPLPEPPAPRIPTETIVTPATPVSVSYTEAIPTSESLYTVAPPPPVLGEPLMPQVLPKKIDTGPSPLHTYTSDFADRIDTKGASTFSVLAAQSDAGGTLVAQPTPNKSHKGALIVAFSVLLLVVAGAGAYAAYRYVSSRSYVPLVATVPSLVFADERESVTGEGQALIQAVVASSQKSLGQGLVRVLYLTEASTTANNQQVTIALPGGRLIGALQLSAPDILLRNVGTESTLGVVHAGNESRVFFILRALSYERTFAGMLAWESTIQSQLAEFYPSYSAPPAPAPTVVTTTKIIKGRRVISTSTVDAVVPEAQPSHFVDEVASNHDVRALKDSYGNTLLLYGYRDKQTLIIARDEAAFAELSNRLAATKQQ